MSGLPTSLKEQIGRLSAPGPEKFAAGKELMALSLQHPDQLAPYVDELSDLLKAKNQLIKWATFRIVGNLASELSEHQAEALLDLYLAPIPGPEMITAANAIAGAVKIAACHPGLAAPIITAILQAEHGRYKTEECTNVVIGHALTALGSLEDLAGQREQVLAFANRQTANPRPGTQKKAERLHKTLRGERRAGRSR
jgi:hypothetical protein